MEIGESTYKLWQRRIQAVLRTQRVVVSGLKHIPLKGAGVVTPNHLNWKDVFFIGGVIPRQIHYVATYELFHIPDCERMISEYMIEEIGNWGNFLSKVISERLAKIIVPRVVRMRHIPIRRNSRDIKFFELAKESLKAGNLICIFPEGGIGVGGKLRRFKLGAAKMVHDLLTAGLNGIPLIPIGVKGTDKLFGPGRKLSLRVGEPLYIEDHLKRNERETLVLFADLLRENVKTLIK